MPRLAGLLRSDWEDELARSGLAHVAPRGTAVDGEVSCPACGHTGALVDAACADCGLRLG